MYRWSRPPDGLRGAALVLAAVLLTTACGASMPAAEQTTPASTPAPVRAHPPTTAGTGAATGAMPGRGDLIAARVGGPDVAARRLRFVDARSGSIEADLPDGVIDRDAGLVYVTAPESGGTRVSALDLTTGLAVRSGLAPGILVLPTIGVDATPVGLSGDGGTLVLVEASGAEAKAPPSPDAVAPISSRFAVLDTGLAADARPVQLEGRYSFDALSPNGNLLYLVEHLPLDHPTDYQVRAYDVAVGALRDGVIVDKAAGSLLMSGEPVAQVPSHGGGWIYTLYRNATEGPFIHALDAQDSFALCIFPARRDPALSAASAARSWELGLSPDGGWLYAANSRLGTVLQVQTATTTMTRTVDGFDGTPSPTSGASDRAGSAADAPPRGMAIADDGLYLTTADAVLRLTVPSLSPADRWPVTSTVAGLAARPAGGSYSVTADGALGSFGEGVAATPVSLGGPARILWVQRRP